MPPASIFVPGRHSARPPCPAAADIIAERFEAALPDTFVSDYRAALREAFARQLEEVSSRGPREALHRFFDGVEA